MATNQDFVARYDELAAGFRSLHGAMPRTMSGLASMHSGALGAGALPAATKELMALAISIATHCDGCIAYHLRGSLDAGATREEIEETVGVAIFMGGGPSAVYGADTLTALDQFEQAGQPEST